MRRAAHATPPQRKDKAPSRIESLFAAYCTTPLPAVPAPPPPLVALSTTPPPQPWWPQAHGMLQPPSLRPGSIALSAASVYSSKS